MRTSAGDVKPAFDRSRSLGVLCGYTIIGSRRQEPLLIQLQSPLPSSSLKCVLALTQRNLALSSHVVDSATEVLDCHPGWIFLRDGLVPTSALFCACL